MERLKNKVALITGGNSGIGAETAMLFAEEGAAVVIAARRVENLREIEEQILAKGGTVRSMQCDVTKKEDCERVVRDTFEQFGRLDILVCSAGVLDYNRSVKNMTEELWDSTIAINQSGVFYCCRAALKYMEQQGFGSIVNVSSVAAISANSGCAYTSSKHAVLAMSKNIAIQYAGTAIRCNVVLPGRTATPMNSDMEYFKRMDHEMMEKCGKHMPRLPEKLPARAQADAILFFAGDESKYVSGQWLAVDWGGSKQF